jgi:perosamine synthetase
LIPVFEPQVADDDVAAVLQALRDGEISGSFGRRIPDFESAFAAYCGVRHGIAVSSGTTALHLAIAAAELPPGSEVLVSATTNIATALAVYHNGHIPIPVDSERDTWNLDLRQIEGMISPKTRAIIPVHLYGHPVDMDDLCRIAERHGLLVVEDCAESHGATVRGRKTGSFGDMSCFSFYANKVITTGEGGMVLTDDERLAERLRLLRNLAFTTPRFYHEVPGYNFRMTGLQAAMGHAQLKRIDEIITRKREIAEIYNRHLSGLPGLQLPVERPWARNVYWMYGLVVGQDFGINRDALAQHLKEAGIDTRTFFCPMNQQPFLRGQTGFRETSCPVSDDLWQRGLYLPSSLNLDETTITHIAHEIARASSRQMKGQS